MHDLNRSHQLSFEGTSLSRANCKASALKPDRIKAVCVCKAYLYKQCMCGSQVGQALLFSSINTDVAGN